MDEETVTTKEAAFMLDTDMEQDMKTYGEEVTLYAIKYINRTPQLYKNTQENLKYEMSVADTCLQWALDHNNEFGDLFQTELESVNWKEVARRI